MGNRTGQTLSPLLEATRRFHLELREVKRGLKPAGFHWYPYSTATAFDFIDGFFDGEPEKLAGLASGMPVLDIGCADGDLAFFLERLGVGAVTAIDRPATNFNGMKGVYALKEHLASKIEIREADIDQPLTLSGQYGLTFCLGVLYHLKNPFQLPESIARISKHCVISTRIMALTPDRKADLRAYPVGYLLDKDELNADSTNYWVSTDEGLGRLCERAGWSVVRRSYSAASDSSDPVHAANDVRAYYVLESIVSDPARHGVLLYGWHESEELTWRWTERRFGIRLDPPCKGAEMAICLEFGLHAELPRDNAASTVNVRCDGRPAGSATVREAGRHEFRFSMPEGWAPEGPFDVEVEASHALPADADPRERCLNVVSVRAEAKG